MSNHYETLGVTREATADEIKAAYRRLASEHHPDRGGDAQAMAAVNRAWEVLSDPERRKQYDEHGDDSNIVDRARGMLAEQFRMALDRDEPLLATVRSSIQTEAGKAAMHAESAEQRIAKLRSRRDKISAAGENLVHLLIDAEIQSLAKQIEGAKNFQRLTAEALRQLEQYTSLESPPPASLMQLNPLFGMRGGSSFGRGVGSW